MTRISHFKIGVFFITSVVLLTIGLFWIGAQDYFQSTATYAAYFDTSVQGLGAGSKVTYLGLDVGRVESLNLVSKGGKDWIQVVMVLDSEFRVEDNMVVRRELKGVTGQCRLSIVQSGEEKEELNPDIDFSGPYPVIPTMPGRMEQVEKALGDLYNQAKSLDIPGLVAEWTATARTARKALDREDIDSALKSMETAFADVSRVSNRLEQAATSLTDGNLDATLKNLAASSQTMRRITASVEQSLSELEPDAVPHTLQSLNQTLHTVDKSVQSTQTRIDESLRHFQQGMIRLNQVLSEIQDLARTLRTEPGRIFSRPGTRDPFQE
mgnify:FL=1